MRDGEFRTPLTPRRISESRPRPVEYGIAAPENPPSAEWTRLYVRMIRRHALKILLFSICGGFIGFVWMLFQPVVYKAQTTLEIVGVNESFMNLDRSDPQAGTGSLSSTAVNIQTQLRLLESPSLVQAALQRVQQENLFIAPPHPSRFSRLRGWLRISPEEPVTAMKQALGMASGTVSARSVAGTRLIEIGCETTSPEAGSAFINTLAVEYIEQSMQVRLKGVQRTIEWLSGQLQQAKTRLEAAEQEQQKYVSGAGLMFVSPDNTLSETKLRQLQSELSSIQADRIAKQAIWEMASKSPVEALPEVVDDPALRSLEIELGGLRKQLAEVSTTLAPENYKVKRVTAQIAEIESTLQKQRNSVMRKIRNNYDAAQNREKLLQGAYGSQARSLAQEAEKATKYNILKRDVEIARQGYNVLLTQLNQSGLALAVPTNAVRVVDPSDPPGDPSKPQPGVYTGWGIATGMSLALMIAWVTEHADQSIRGPGEIAGLPELGVVPSADYDFSEKKGLLSRAGRVVEAPPRLPSGAKEERVELASLHQKPTLLAESFRTTLASLMIDETGRWPGAVVITSPSQGEGKTTISCNMAIAMAETKQKIVLVDADLRRPRLHEIFGLDGSKGLTTIIHDPRPMHAIRLEDYVQPTAVPGLWIMTSGALSRTKSGAFCIRTE